MDGKPNSGDGWSLRECSVMDSLGIQETDWLGSKLYDIAALC